MSTRLGNDHASLPSGAGRDQEEATTQLQPDSTAASTEFLEMGAITTQSENQGPGATAPQLGVL